MDIRKILLEADIPVESVFNGHDVNRYSFIWRDVTKFVSVESKRDIVDKIEKLRLSSGGNLPIETLNPQMFVATQSTIDSDNVKKIIADYNEIEELPFVVKLNGVYYLIDGHHRTTVALVAKKDYVKCRFLDLDNGNFI